VPEGKSFLHKVIEHPKRGTFLMVAKMCFAPTISCAMARPLPQATRRTNNLLSIGARPADETARRARGSGQNGAAPPSVPHGRFGHRNLNGRWFKSN